MSLLHSVEDPEYWPEFGSIVIRDAAAPTGVDVAGPDAPMLDEYEVSLPWGTLGRAGGGWIHLSAGDAPQRIRIEVHDGAAPFEPGDAWSDVLETPYHSSTGWTGLTTTTSGPGNPGLELGVPGPYRVRVHRRLTDPIERESDWLLQFWPELLDASDASLRPPRWLLRDGPPAQRPDDLAADLLAVIAWSRGTRIESTLAELADRLLAPVAAVRAALGFAVDQGQLTVAGDPTRDAVAVTVMASPPVRRPPVKVTYAPVHAPGAPWDRFGPYMVRPTPVHAARAGAAPGQGVSASAGPGWGAPPLAGYVTFDGRVFHPSAGSQPLGQWEAKGYARAAESAYGIVVSSDAGVALVRWDGRVDVLHDGPGRAAVLSDDGRLLTLTVDLSRRRGVARELHLVDLADGSRRVLPWNGDDTGLGPIAVHRGVVYFATGTVPFGTMRWIPGEPAEPLPYRLYQIDPVSGAQLVCDPATNTPAAVLTQGVLRPLPFVPSALVPGGSRECRYSGHPPEVAVRDLTTGEQRTWPLPPQTVTVPAMPGYPVWEDANRVLFRVDPQLALASPAVRLDLRTGEFELVPLDHPPVMFVKPHPSLPHES